MASKRYTLGGARDATQYGVASGATSAHSEGGTSDVRAARARELHRQAAEAEQHAARLRAERDSIIRQLRAEDSKRWSYGALSKVIGCSRELIAQVSKRHGP